MYAISKWEKKNTRNTKRNISNLVTAKYMSGSYWMLYGVLKDAVAECMSVCM